MKSSIKSYMSFFLICVLVLTLSGCFYIPTKTPIKQDDNVGSPAPIQSDKPDDDSPKGPGTSKKVTIEETVLLDQNNIKITAKELVSDPISGEGIKVLVENNTDRNIVVLLDYLIVNNYMITGLFAPTVFAGKKANDVIYLYPEEMEAAVITTISEIVTRFDIVDSDSFDTIFMSDEVVIKTSAYGTVKQPVIDNGKELFNQEGIRIIGRYIEEDSTWGAGIKLFIENNYGQDIIVLCEEMSVNGFMMTPYFSCNVNNGRMALDEITIMSDDLEDNDIEKIEEVELVFYIVDPDSFDTMIKSSPITFTKN